MKQELNISTISVSQLTNALFTRLHTRVHESISNFAPGFQLLDIEAQDMTQWGGIIITLTDISKQTQGSVKTATLVSVDKKRGDVIRYVFNRIDTARKSPFEIEKEAGTLLYSITKSYKGIANESYDEETQHVDGMLYDLSKPTYADAIATLNLGESLGTLGDVNAEFKEIQKSRADERVESAPVGKSREIRAEATRYFDYAMRSIEGAYRFADRLGITGNDRESIKTLADTINQIIAEVKATATATSAKKSADTTPTDTAATE